MRLVRVPLTEQEEAHVALILEVHRQTMAEIERLHRQAEETKAARFVPISRAKGVPDGVLVNVVARANSEPAYLTYEGPDEAPAGPVADGLGQVSEKSTSAPAQES